MWLIVRMYWGKEGAVRSDFEMDMNEGQREKASVRGNLSLLWALWCVCVCVFI